MATIAYDLDDVLCSRDENLPVESVIGPEKYDGCIADYDQIAIVNAAHDAGHTIIIYTSRGMGQFNGNVVECDLQLRGITTYYLEQWGVKYHQLVFGKIHFDVLVDNKAYNSLDIGSYTDLEKAIRSQQA